MWDFAACSTVACHFGKCYSELPLIITRLGVILRRVIRIGVILTKVILLCVICYVLLYHAFFVKYNFANVVQLRIIVLSVILLSITQMSAVVVSVILHNVILMNVASP